MPTSLKPTLAQVNPSLAAQLAPGNAHYGQCTAGSEQRPTWQCPDCGHQWQAAIKTRHKGSGCPVCAIKRRSLLRAQQAAKANPITDKKLLAEANVDISGYAKGSKTKVSWTCLAEGHTWTTSIESRCKKNGTGCPHCAKKTRGESIHLAAVKREAVSEPVLLAEADVDISGYTKWSRVRVPWTCEDCAYQWTAAIYSRTRGNGCRRCSNEVRGIAQSARNAAANPITDPLLLKEANTDLSPYSKQSSASISWTCSGCGHNWNARICNRSNGTGCPGCTISGYKDNLPGVIYLITNEERTLVKVGISNQPKERLHRHSYNGLGVVIACWQTPRGWQARDVERLVLQTLRKTLHVLPTSAYTKDGFTETFDVSEVTRAAGQDGIVFLEKMIRRETACSKVSFTPYVCALYGLGTCNRADGQ